jgi:hypothetical protein
MDGTEERTTRRAMKGEEESSGTPYPVTLLPILKIHDLAQGLILGRSTTCIGAYERIGTFGYLSVSVFERMKTEYGACDITLI